MCITEIQQKFCKVNILDHIKYTLRNREDRNGGELTIMLKKSDSIRKIYTKLKDNNRIKFKFK